MSNDSLLASEALTCLYLGQNKILLMICKWLADYKQKRSGFYVRHAFLLNSTNFALRRHIQLAQFSHILIGQWWTHPLWPLSRFSLRKLTWDKSHSTDDCVNSFQFIYSNQIIRVIITFRKYIWHINFSWKRRTQKQICLYKVFPKQKTKKTEYNKIPIDLLNKNGRINQHIGIT